VPALRHHAAGRVTALARAAARPASRVAARRHAMSPRRRRRTFTASLAAALALALALPGQAAALPSVDDIVNKAIDAIANKFFGVGFDGLTGTFFTWLVNAPNFAGDASNGELDGKLEELCHISQGIAFALVGAVMTFSALQYWLAGVADLSSDGSELLRGITRGVGVALLVLAWPWIFENAVAVSNQVTAVLVDGRDLDILAAAIFGALAVTALFSAGIALIFGILLAIAGVVVLCALVSMKIAISATLAVIYAGMPLALVMLPIEPLAWVPRLATRTLAAVLLVPVVWALCLATFLAVGFDALTLSGGGGILDKLIKPLTALALMWLMFSLPRMLMRVAAIGSIVPSATGNGRAGMVARVGEHLAFREFGRVVGQWRGDDSGSSSSGEGTGQQRGRRPAPAGGGEGEGDGGGSTTAPAGGGQTSGIPYATVLDSINGLPTQPGEDAFGTGMENIDARRREMEGMDPAAKRQAGEQALARLDAAGYKDRVAAYTRTHTPQETTARMADASTADGLSPETAEAFVTWGALDAGTRSEVLAADAAKAAGPQEPGDAGATGPPPAGDANGGPPPPPEGGTGGAAPPPPEGAATGAPPPGDGGGVPGDGGGAATAPPPGEQYGGSTAGGDPGTPASFVRAEDIGFEVLDSRTEPLDGGGSGDPGGSATPSPPGDGGPAGPPPAPGGGASDGPATPPPDDGPFALPAAGTRNGDIPSPSDDGLDEV